MIEMAGPTVIVQPDSAGAWLGLIGVVAGVVITSAANWLQHRTQGRDERQRELDAATGQVIAAANSVILLVRDRADAKDKPGRPNATDSDAEWADKVTSAAERMQLADQVIGRYGQAGLASASRHVVTEILNVALAGGGQPQEGAAHEAIAAFQVELGRR